MVGAVPVTVSVLGATGSIGKSAAAVIGANKDRYRVEAVAGGSNPQELARVARQLGARFAAIFDQAAYPALKEALAGSGITAAAGAGAVCEAAARPADRVVAAITGIAGLAPTCAALAQGSTVALANKEAMVSAGAAVLKLAASHGATILPLDSEHNSLFQAMGGAPMSTVARLTLTASGGPFRLWSAEAIAGATLAEALKHPNFAMGSKITIDSATMMNKGLELIEAQHLFGLPEERIDVLVHPQQMIHGLVTFTDGSVNAGLAVPDMRVPMAHCLAWPERCDSATPALDLIRIGRLDFEAPDETRFPALRLAREAMRANGAVPTVLNAANEVAVAAFLNSRIGFADIVKIVETVMIMPAMADLPAPASVEDAVSIDSEARLRAGEVLSRLS
ncbi:MAG: 1-deoxy-D-xylulose-5-phosphate reductoisomerase [Proteobacteria bacterium]|nr:1-deoxy-D-xylulose-5-phosphate reductoisomerase [Pseudomonadota bacterium]